MLILFDVDGTLTATTQSDLIGYTAAFERVFGIPLPSHDWHTYRHVTDTGIIREVLEAHRGTAHTPVELARFEETFAALLQREGRANPAAFGEIPGATAMLEELRRRGAGVALASGGMRRTALYKLSCIGVDGTAYPGAFANDAESREEIARRAIARAGGPTEDVVYVGDGLWDVRTSAALGMRFVGITRESCPDRLRNGGAGACLEDYTNLEAFFDALATAPVPDRRKAGLKAPDADVPARDNSDRSSAPTTRNEGGA